MIEQQALYLNAAGVSGKSAAGADHAVAWDVNRDRILPDGRAHGTNGSGAAKCGAMRLMITFSTLASRTRPMRP